MKRHVGVDAPYRNRDGDGAAVEKSREKTQPPATAASQPVADLCPRPSERVPLLHKLVEEQPIAPHEAALMAHIEACPRCQRELRVMRQVGLRFLDSAVRGSVDED